MCSVVKGAICKILRLIPGSSNTDALGCWVSQVTNPKRQYFTTHFCILSKALWITLWSKVARRPSLFTFYALNSKPCCTHGCLHFYLRWLNLFSGWERVPILGLTDDSLILLFALLYLLEQDNFHFYFSCSLMTAQCQPEKRSNQPE